MRHQTHRRFQRIPFTAFILAPNHLEHLPKFALLNIKHAFSSSASQIPSSGSHVQAGSRDRRQFRIINRDAWKSRRCRLPKTMSLFAFREMDSRPQSRECYLYLMSIASLMLRNEHHWNWLLLSLKRVFSGHAHCGESVTSDQAHSNFCFAFSLRHLVGEALLLGLLHL